MCHQGQESWYVTKDESEKEAEIRTRLQSRVIKYVRSVRIVASVYVCVVIHTWTQVPGVHNRTTRKVDLPSPTDSCRLRVETNT